MGVRLFKKILQRPVKKQKLEAYLREPLKGNTYEPDPYKKQLGKSRLALLEFLRRAKEMLPRTRHVYIGKDDGVCHDFSGEYLRRMFELQQHLMRKCWDDACSDLVGVIHLYHVEDGRILYSIITLLEEYVL